MKLRWKLALAGCGIIIAALFALAFLRRPPVLVVGDELFISVYGKERIKRRQIWSSLVLRRPLKQVTVADSAGSDIIVFAIEEAVSRPYCVIFPRRYSAGARRYSGQHPDIPTVLLSGRPGGRNSGGSEEAAFFEFFSNTELDFYRAGLCAGILCGTKEGEIPVFLDNIEAGESGFLRGLSEQGVAIQPFFYSSPSQAVRDDYLVAVIAGPAADFLDKNRVPVILFTWLGPFLTSRETVVIFDDSPWAQAVSAVKMVKENQKTGGIPSNIMVFSAKIADNRVLRGLKKAARAGL
jgi:hypothetical protein